VTRTISNDVHEIKEILGIEAARNFLISEFITVTSSEGIYINPRHVTLLVDFMTSLGDVFGITFSGISRQQVGPLARMSDQRTMDVVKEASGFGVSEAVRGTSASIYIGKENDFGAAYNPDFIDPEIRARFEKELQEDTVEYDPAEYNDTLRTIGEVEYNVDVPVAEGEEVSMFEGIEPMVPLGIGGLGIPVPISLSQVSVNLPPDPSVLTMIKSAPVMPFGVDRMIEMANNVPCERSAPTSIVEVDDMFGGVTAPLAVNPVTLTVPPELTDEMYEVQHEAVSRTLSTQEVAFADLGDFLNG
jgi:hypothetical protein